MKNATYQSEAQVEGVVYHGPALLGEACHAPIHPPPLCGGDQVLGGSMAVPVRDAVGLAVAVTISLPIPVGQRDLLPLRVS